MPALDRSAFLAAMAWIALTDCARAATSSQVLDFNIATAGRTREIQQLGFTVRGSLGDFYHIASIADFFPVNGSNYISQPGFTGNVDITHPTNVFSASQLDVAEYSTAFDRPQAFTVEGEKADGTLVSASFQTDGITDGSGPTADFETFPLGPEFTGLVRLTVLHPSSNAIAFDNLVFTLGAKRGVIVPNAPVIEVAPVRSSHQAKIFWYGVASAFQVERKIGTGEWTVVGRTSGSQSNFLDSGLTPNSNYRYRVVAFNASGQSSVPSTEIEVTTAAAPSFVSTDLDFNDANSGWSVVFGQPSVASSFAGMAKALVFDAVASYEQISLGVPLGYAGYQIDFDVASEHLENSNYAFTLFLDTPEVRTLSLHPLGNSFEVFIPGRSNINLVPFHDGQIFHVRVLVDLFAGNWTISIDGIQALSTSLQAAALKNLRFSMAPWKAGSADAPATRAGIDNLKVTIVDPSAGTSPLPTATPTPTPASGSSSIPAPDSIAPPKIKIPSQVRVTGRRIVIKVPVDSQIPIRSLAADAGRQGTALVRGSNPYRVTIIGARKRTFSLQLRAVNANGAVGRKTITVIWTPGKGAATR